MIIILQSFGIILTEGQKYYYSQLPNNNWTRLSHISAAVITKLNSYIHT